MVARAAEAKAGSTGKSRARPQLDAVTIVSAALRLAADGSVEPLTVRRLGKELGADPTAIYRHFRDKDELLRGVLDRLIADAVEAVDPTAPWRDRLTQLARVSLDTMCDHPGIGALAASQSTGGQGELAAIEMIVVAMNEAGLNRQDSVRFYAVYSSYVIAFSSGQAASLLTDDRADDQSWWIGSSSALGRTRHPAVTSVRDELESLRDRDVYEAGIEVILDAVEASSRSPRQNRGSTRGS